MSAFSWILVIGLVGVPLGFVGYVYWDDPKSFSLERVRTRLEMLFRPTPKAPSSMADLHTVQSAKGSAAAIKHD